MKMIPEHYKELKIEIDKVMTQEIKNEYKKKGYSKIRFVWVLFWSINLKRRHKLINDLYDYLYDCHVQTALFKIIGTY